MTFALIIFAVSALDVAFWFWASAHLRGLRHGRAGRIAVSILVFYQIVCLASFIFTPTLLRSAHGLLPSWPIAAVFLWHILILPMWFVGALAEGAVRVIVKISRRKPAQAAPTQPAATPTRRQVLSAIAVATPPLLLGAGVLKSSLQLGTYRVRHIDVPIENLPRGLAGCTIAHLSDSHVGRFTRPAQLAAAVRDADALEPDVIVFTGDLIDFALEDLPDAIDFIRALRPRRALAMCIGNHDLIKDPRSFLRDVHSAGLPLLINRDIDIAIGDATINLWGVHWDGDEQKRNALVNSLAPKRDRRTLPILLAHHPHCFEAATDRGFPLTLSGHTHGGMLNLNDHIGAGPALYRYWSGLYQRPGGSLVVSNGIGNWFPLRINSPAEIALLTLREA